MKNVCRKLVVLGRYPTVPGLWADVDAENPGEEGDAAVQQNRAHRVFFTRIPIRLLSYVPTFSIVTNFSYL